MSLLFGASCACTTADPCNLFPENILVLALGGKRNIFTFGFQHEIALIIGIIAVDVSFVDLNDPVCYTIEKITVMCEHEQCTPVVVQIFL